MTDRTLTVLVAGGSGPSGIAVARSLAQAGMTVYTVGSDSTRIAAAAETAGSGVIPLTCDLAVLPAVRELHDELTSRAGRIDGVIHLVGGWRGARGIADQSDEDWDFLETGSLTTLRNVTRVFYGDLVASDAGRFAMVSSTAVTAPAAAVASYVAAKAAAEAWTMAVADGFQRDQLKGTAGQSSPELPSAPELQDGPELHSAAVVLVLKALVDPAMRSRHPERRFPGFTDVEDLAAAVVGLFEKPAAELNGQRILLTP
jgi:NAD(P)-dependent dehydrogenase (short-subunit alcohol dehydrogenase family)